MSGTPASNVVWTEFHLHTAMWLQRPEIGCYSVSRTRSQTIKSDAQDRQGMTKQNPHLRNPVGCAINFQDIQNATEKPSSGPFADDCPTTLLHSVLTNQKLTHSDRSDKSRSDCYTTLLQNVRTHLISRSGGRIYYRRRVPEALRGVIGRTEVWRSLGTDSPTVAKRRALRVSAQVEHEFEVARLKVGLNVDRMVLEDFSVTTPLASEAVVVEAEPLAGVTLCELYDAYMNDPTRDWSPTTRNAYKTTKRVVMSILGADTPVDSITRSQCREMIEILRWQPRNASKLFPKLGPVEIAELAKRDGRTDLINAANINTYLNKLGGVFNWAVKEEILDRNPAKGLRVPDPVARRDKRLPFSPDQLRKIFSAPIYTGCRDDAHGYAVPGAARPRNARFWIPLVSMFGGGFV